VSPQAAVEEAAVALDDLDLTAPMRFDAANLEREDRRDPAAREGLLSGRRTARAVEVGRA